MDDAQIDKLLGPAPNLNNPEAAAKANGLDPKLFAAVVSVESGGNPNAVSSKGAVGAGQVMPASAAKPGYGVQPFNPKDLNGAAALLKKYIDLAGGDPIKGLRMYKQGPNGTLDTKSADEYVTKIYKKWAPDPSVLLGAAPKQKEEASPIAKSPDAVGAPSNQPRPSERYGFNMPNEQAAAEQADLEKNHPLIAAINRPADRTVDLMKQSTEKTWEDIKKLTSKKVWQTPDGPLKGAFNVALDAVGMAFSPVTSVTQAFLGDPVKGAAHQVGVSPKADPLLDMASQLAVPIAAARSTFMQQAMGPAGKFLLGVEDTYDARIAAGQGAGMLSAQLVGLQGKSEALKAQWLDTIERVKPDNYKDMAADIAHNIETGGKHPLSPEAQAFKAQYLDPALKQIDQMATALTNLTGQRMTKVKDYYPRNVTSRVKDDRFPGVVDVRVPQDTKVLKTSPGELQERTAGGVEDPATGEKAVFVQDNSHYIGQGNARMLVMKNKQVIDSGVIDNGVLKGGTGTQWQVNDGTMRDIEQHSNITYTKDPLADIAKAHSDVFNALANAQAIERMKVTPEFLTQATRPGQAPRASTWVDAKNFALGTHQLDGWHLSPRMQEVLNDFQRSGITNQGINALAGLNRAMVGSLFLNPLAHIMNVAWHSWVEKGLVSPGSVTGAAIGGAVGGVPGAAVGATIGSLIHSPTEVKSLYTAMKAVATRDDNYMRYLKEGAGLMQASRFTRDFFNKALKMTGTQPDEKLMASFGFNLPKDMVAAIYRGAGNVMWGTNDVIMMQSYLANEARLAHGRMAGMTTAQVQRQAISDTEKHVPNYRVPSRIGPTALELIPGGAQARRGMAQLMQGQMGIARFPRYDYGRIASYVNMMRDTIAGLHGAVTGDAKLASARDAMTAMNQAAALGFGAFVMYPMVLDAVAQAVTGNKNASWQRYGPFTVPSLLYNYLNPRKGHEADWEQIAASMLPMGPIPMMAAEMLYNRDLFTGKSLNLPQGAFSFIMGQFSPVEDLMRIENGKITPRQWLAQQFGIKDPTPAQVEKAHKFFLQQQKAHAKYLRAQEEQK